MISAHGESGRDDEPDWERYFEPVVLTAAVASVPAVFLATLDGFFGAVGLVLNWLSMILLTAESALLFWTSHARLHWLRTHWWLVAITLVTIPAVIFTFGPLQVLRLVRVIAAVQLVRVLRLVKAARILRQRLHLHGRWWYAVWVGALLLGVGFLAIVLSDSTSTSRRLLDAAVEYAGPGAVITVGALVALVAVIVWLLLRKRTDRAPG